MKDLNEGNFGILIAFLLPGFIFLWGLSYSSEQVSTWMAKSSDKDAVTVGGFLYSTLASFALGLIISAVRWLLVDTILWVLGVRDPGLNFSRLKESKEIRESFNDVVANNLRYYQYYSNTLIAVVGAFLAYLASPDYHPSRLLWAVAISLAIVLFAASWDTRRKYFKRAEKVLS